MSFEKGLCIVTGVGPGTGAALARRYAQGGYRVAMMARVKERLDELEKEIDGSIPCLVDVADETALDKCMADLVAEHGPVRALVHNAVASTRGDFTKITPEDLRRNMEVNVIALLRMVQAVAPAMEEAGSGSIVATGNTSAYRGKEFFAGLAPTKAAQRILLETMARKLGPKGIHVAFVAIDAAIDVPWTREMLPDAPDEFFCQPRDIAEECYRIAHQARSAWTFDTMIRPHVENW
ncbi:MAG: SDR family NAD(P)-dependent oxidoreductase [Alphaproteobacteria bacterium]